jgi:hypothetical protein
MGAAAEPRIGITEDTGRADDRPAQPLPVTGGGVPARPCSRPKTMAGCGPDDVGYILRASSNLADARSRERPACRSNRRSGRCLMEHDVARPCFRPAPACLVWRVSSAWRNSGSCWHAFNRRKPLAASCMAAAVQRNAIAASRQRLTLRQTRRMVPIMFSMMLVQASERRSGRGKPSRMNASHGFRRPCPPLTADRNLFPHLHRL